MATITATASLASRRAPWWRTASRIGLILLGAFNLYAAVADLAATAGTGLPSDHAGTFADVTGRTKAARNANTPQIRIMIPTNFFALHRSARCPPGICSTR